MDERALLLEGCRVRSDDSSVSGLRFGELYLLAHNSSQKLARRALGNGWNDKDAAAELLVVCHVSGDPCGDFGRKLDLLHFVAEDAIVAWDNVSSRQLCCLGMVDDSHHECVCDLWVREKHRLQFCWWDLEALVL